MYIQLRFGLNRVQEPQKVNPKPLLLALLVIPLPALLVLVEPQFLLKHCNLTVQIVDFSQVLGLPGLVVRVV